MATNAELCFFRLINLLAFLVLTLSVSKCFGFQGIFKFGGVKPSPKITQDQSASFVNSVFFNKLQYERKWETNWLEDYKATSPQFLCTLPDSMMPICIVLVVSYIMYIIIALFFAPKEEESLNFQKNRNLQMLMDKRRLADNIPGKIKNLYEVCDVHGLDQTPLLGGIDTESSESQEKKPIPQDQCVSAFTGDLSQKENAQSTIKVI